ncbi:hypothetical protein [Streptomyces chrestomyceticus]|uniref:hypothetical protein n=1 Tax=Streptomyces chrestomyceticus TaxID=68185 RepID=UPI00378FAFE5
MLVELRALHSALNRWLRGHHRTEAEADGAVVHIFVQGKDGSAVYGDFMDEPKPQTNEHDIAVPMGAAVLTLHTRVDPAELMLKTAQADLTIPFQPPVKLGQTMGSLRDKITLPIQSDVSRGSIKLYLRRHLIWAVR